MILACYQPYSGQFCTLRKYSTRSYRIPLIRRREKKRELQHSLNTKLHGDEKGGKTFLLLKYFWPNTELEIFSEIFFLSAQKRNVSLTTLLSQNLTKQVLF